MVAVIYMQSTLSGSRARCVIYLFGFDHVQNFETKHSDSHFFTRHFFFELQPLFLNEDKQRKPSPYSLFVCARFWKLRVLDLCLCAVLRSILSLWLARGFYFYLHVNIRQCKLLESFPGKWPGMLSVSHLI